MYSMVFMITLQKRCGNVAKSLPFLVDSLNDRCQTEDSINNLGVLNVSINNPQASY